MFYELFFNVCRKADALVAAVINAEIFKFIDTVAHISYIRALGDYPIEHSVHRSFVGEFAESVAYFSAVDRAVNFVPADMAHKNFGYGVKCEFAGLGNHKVAVGHQKVGGINGFKDIVVANGDYLFFFAAPSSAISFFVGK